MTSRSEQLTVLRSSASTIRCPQVRSVREADRLAALLGNREVGSAIGVGMSTATGLAEPGSCSCAALMHATRLYRRHALFWAIAVAGMVRSPCRCWRVY
jgi:hypothetical protein